VQTAPLGNAGVAYQAHAVLLVPQRRIAPFDSYTQIYISSSLIYTVCDGLALVLHRSPMSAVINELAVGGQTLPWKKLPMALACKRLYITGFPFECAPTIVDDKASICNSLVQMWLIQGLHTRAGRRHKLSAILGSAKV